MLPGLALALLLLGPPEPGADDYAAAQARLDEGIKLANRDSEQAIATLAPALADLAQFAPKLAYSPGDLDRRRQAQLALAFSYLQVDRRAEAIATIDELVRSGGEAQLRIDVFGPEFAALYRERKTALEREGAAELAIECAQPCRIFIDEQRADPRELLLLGQHRVWIEAEYGEAAPLRTTLELTKPGELIELRFPVLVEAPVDPNPAEPAHRDRKRMLPRWVEATAIGLGAALAIAGGVYLALDGRCREPGVPTTDCPTVNDTAKLGYPMLGVGAGLVVLGGVMLGVDEVRSKSSGAPRQQAKRVMLSVGFRF